MNCFLVRSLASLAALSCCTAMAIPVTITDPYMNLENRAVNSLGFSVGHLLRFGASNVKPNGDGGTTGIGTTVDPGTGQPITRTINFAGAPVTPNFFSRYLTDSPSYYAPWTLTFANGPDSAQAVVSLPAGTKQAPFVNTITLSGSSAAPTFSWTPPPGTAVNGYRINIYDKSLVSPDSSGQVATRNLAPTVTSYTVAAADFTAPGYAFQLGRSYSIEIGLIQTKDGSSTNLNNNNLAAISRVYADFTATDTAGPSVNLPVTLVNGAFQFNISVEAGKTYYIDPIVATGYDYRIGTGDPSFTSVVLPTGIGDGLYDIFGLGSGGTVTLLAHNWAGGEVFDFEATGIQAFRVAGIEPSAGLDPANVTAFVTGLTFASDGTFTGTQTPIVFEVSAVPEPQTYALMVLGLGLVGWKRFRSRQRRV